MTKYMSIENSERRDIPQNTNEIQKGDLFFQMIDKLFPNKDIPNAYQNFLDFTNKEQHPENRQRLTKVENAERERQRQRGITIQEDVPYSGGTQQNIRIMKALLDGNMMLDEIKIQQKEYVGIDNLGLSPDKISYIKSTMTQEQYNFYMKNMPSGFTKTLEAFDYIQFVSIWDKEIQGIQEAKENMKNLFGSELTDIGADQVSIVNRLADIGPRMDVYKQKYILNTPEIQKRFDEEVRIRIQNYPKTYPDNYKKIVEKCQGDEKLVAEWIKKEVEMEVFIILKNEGIIVLTEEDQKDFAQLNIDFYDKMQELGLQVSATFRDMYDQAIVYLQNLYQSTDAYEQLSQKILSDKDINTHFDKQENKVEKLVADENKSGEYYKNLIKLYPEIDTTNISQSFTEEYFILDPTMQIQDSAPEEVKNAWKLFLERAATKETKMLNRTNATIQRVAIQQCLTSLQEAMDIDIDNQQSLLDKFELEKDPNFDAVSPDLLLKVKGTIDGKKIHIAYDLVTGKVYYQHYMQKASLNQTDAISFGTDQDIKAMQPYMTLPSVGDTIKQGKDTEYASLLSSSATLDEYDQHLQEQLMSSYKRSTIIANEVGQDIIKKNILQDMIIQKIMKLSGRNIADIEGRPEGIDARKYPQTYALYAYFFRSFGYYSMQSLDNISLLNNNMDTLINIQQQSEKYSKEQLIHHQKDNKNTERFFIHDLLHPHTLTKNTPLINQNPERELLSFFELCTIQKGGQSIIDIQMLNDYLLTTTKTTEEKVGKRKGNTSFNILYAQKNDPEKADMDLEEKLKYLI